jgi:hypothetical protein
VVGPCRRPSSTSNRRANTQRLAVHDELLGDLLDRLPLRPMPSGALLRRGAHLFRAVASGPPARARSIRRADERELAAVERSGRPPAASRGVSRCAARDPRGGHDYYLPQPGSLPVSDRQAVTRLGGLPAPQWTLTPVGRPSFSAEGDGSRKYRRK